MNGETGNGKQADDVQEIEDDDLEADKDTESTIVMDTTVDEADTFGDISSELNVEELVAKMEASSDERKRAIRKRLDELRDEREAEKSLDSTYNINLDEDE